MTYPHLDNPAGRLHNLIAEIQQSPEADPLRAALSRILSVEDGDDAEFLRRVAPIFELPAQVREEVAELGYDDDTHIEKLGLIERVLPTLVTSQKVDQFKKQLHADAVHELKTTGAVLHRSRPQGTASEDKLAEIRKQVASLIDEVRDSDLADDVAEFLLDRLHEVLRGIDLYKVVGLSALQATLERSVGSFYMNKDMREKVAGHKVGKKVAKLLGALALALTVVNGSIDAAERVHELLPGDSQVEETISDEEIIEGIIVQNGAKPVVVE